MTRTPATTRDWSDAAARAGALLAVAWLLVLPTFGLGRIDLAGDLGLVAYWTSEVGGTRGLPFLIAALLALVVSRPGLPAQARAREALVLALALAVAAGIGAWANEHLLKPWVGSPRPDLRELFDLGFLPEAPARFYEIGDKATRSARLAEVLGPITLPFGLHPLIRAHWIAETGYSFPSGHAFASMLVASFFLAVALDRIEGRRRWWGLAAVALAVAVCWSRPVLRVHTAFDVTVGAAQGILLGLLTFVLSRPLLPDNPAPER